MDFAIASTTIHVPEVFQRFRELGPNAPIFIAGDVRAPHEAIERLCAEIGDCTYLRPAVQESRYQPLSEAIGWNCIQRRNIATLEAAKTGADVIISLDDDNEPVDERYFEDLERSFETRLRPQAVGPWFNLGGLAEETYTYRGYPYSVPPSSRWRFMEGVLTGFPVGVVNGAIVGDPDIGAVQRIDRNPQVRDYKGEVHKGIMVDPAETRSPLNSQNTAWRRELAHLSCVIPGVGRYDDIWAGYLAQEAMAKMETPWCVLYGKPFVRQDRHAHDLIKDLEDEIYGMRHTEQFVAGNHELPLQAERFLEEWRRAWQRVSPLPQAA